MTNSVASNTIRVKVVNTGPSASFWDQSSFINEDLAHNVAAKSMGESLVPATRSIEGNDVDEKRDMSKVTMRRPRPGRGKVTSIVQQGNPINTSPPSNEHVNTTKNMEPSVSDWTDDDDDVNLFTLVDGGLFQPR